MLPFQPPAIRGVGTVGGFQFVVEDRSGTRSLDELSSAADGLIAKAREDPELRGVFTTFTASTPLLDVEVDRQKAKALGVPIDQIFGTLQLFMGSQYVNDFNYASRTYRVYVQADAQFRDNPRDIGAFYVRSEAGRHDPARVAGEGDAHDQRADHPPLQPVPLGRDQRAARARRRRRARRSRRWSVSPPRACPKA